MPTALTNQTALSLALIEAWTSIRVCYASWVRHIDEFEEHEAPLPGAHERDANLKSRFQSLRRALRNASNDARRCEAYFDQADKLIMLLYLETEGHPGELSEHPEDIQQHVSEIRKWRRSDAQAAPRESQHQPEADLLHPSD